jgi:hypothetical protein
MDCSSCLSFGQACFLTTFGSTPLANGGNLSKAQLKGLPKRLTALAQPKAPFDETLLGLTIFLLSFYYLFLELVLLVNVKETARPLGIPGTCVMSRLGPG